MKLRLISGVSAGFLLVGLIAAQQPSENQANRGWAPRLERAVGLCGGYPIRRDQARGRWESDRQAGGFEQSPRAEGRGQGSAAVHGGSATYKPEFQAKVKDLIDHESRTDPVFYCGRPGVPRIGPPRKIVQLPNEVIFFYEDMSGDTYRVIPTDGRKHREKTRESGRLWRLHRALGRRHAEWWM